jgi:hypothetical protein
MKGRNSLCSSLYLQACRLALAVVAITTVAGTAFGVVLVDYQADTLPPPPWVFINNGPPQERSQHTVFVQDGVLHMIDNALLVGNTLGFLQFVLFDPDQVIEVEFRTRVLSGESALSPPLDEVASFQSSPWGVNSTLSDIHQLDEPPGPHSAEEEALDTSESRYSNPWSYADPTRSASFPTRVKPSELFSSTAREQFLIAFQLCLLCSYYLSQWRAASL